MQKQPSLRRNFLMNTILRAANVIFPLITILYVSRILLPAGLGRVSFATSFMAYFNMAAQLGIPTYGIRACAKVRDDKEELSRVTLELLLLNLIGTVISSRQSGQNTVHDSEPDHHIERHWNGMALSGPGAVYLYYDSLADF